MARRSTDWHCRKCKIWNMGRFGACKKCGKVRLSPTTRASQAEAKCTRVVMSYLRAKGLEGGGE